LLDPSVARLDRDGSWLALTTVRAKFQLLSTDTAFRESWHAADQALGDRALSVVQRVAILTVRPETLTTGAAGECVEFLRDNDFAVRFGRLFRYTRRSIREVWRYQWNVATLDSMRVIDLVHRGGPALMLFLADRAPGEVPASPRLTGLKGTSDPAGRTPAHLRSVLRAPNRVLVMAHAPDEPIDLVRELGVLFGPGKLAAIYRRLGDGLADELPDVRGFRVPGAHVDVDRAVGELLDALGPGDAADQVREARDGGTLDWGRWTAALAAAGRQPGAWPEVLVASQYVGATLPGATPLIRETGRRGWLAGAGRIER
jgi:hypothetical protein